jgi:mannitol/fructose-specific phosphotransferase system IIA component (Ntr-type)
MQMHELITDPAQVVADLQATDRWAAIDELIAVLAKAGRIAPNHAAAVTAAVRAREETMSTGIGHGIALPHAPTVHVARVEAALGIAHHAVDFEALDGEPVYIVLLFVAPNDQFQAHLNTLANISRVLNNASTRQRLRDAATADEVIAITREASLG